MPKRKRLATGIYEDAYGLSVVYQGADGKPIETRFARGTSVERLERWRARQIELREAVSPRPPRNTVTRLAVRYLKRLKGLPSYGAEKSHLKAWLRLFGPLSPRSITKDKCELTIARWRQDGYAPRTIRHRCRVFESFWRWLYGPDAITPLAGVERPKKPKPRPVSVPDAQIAAVALELRKHEIAGLLRDAKTRARFLVLATHGRRPIELQRAQPLDVDLEARRWITRTAKGGPHSALLLNDEQLAAWRLFIAAQAWGTYDTRSFVRTLQRCGWPKGIRPYNLRHSTAQTIRRRGGDAADVQEQLGHASITTAREFYYDTPLERQVALSQLLDKRFAGEVFAQYSHDKHSHGRPRHDAKGRELPRKIKVAVRASGRPSRSPNSRKTA